MKKAWLAGLLALAWTAFSNYWYLCKTCGCCGDQTLAAPALSLPSTDAFQFTTDGKADFAETALWPAWKAKTLAFGGLGDTLVAIGHYRADETGGEKLGLARAEVIREKLGWEKSRTVLRAKMVEGLKLPGMAAEVEWRKAKIDQNASTIISQGAETIILFPFRSAVKDVDAKVDAFLKDLIAREKGTGSKISIVGHTDNVGEEGPNQKLGQARADFIRNILRKGGIARERITTDSKGETAPLAPNDTDGGRHQNRRVVLTVTP